MDTPGIRAVSQETGVSVREPNSIRFGLPNDPDRLAAERVLDPVEESTIPGGFAQLV